MTEVPLIYLKAEIRIQFCLFLEAYITKVIYASSIEVNLDMHILMGWSNSHSINLPIFPESKLKEYEPKILLSKLVLSK